MRDMAVHSLIYSRLRQTTNPEKSWGFVVFGVCGGLRLTTAIHRAMMGGRMGGYAPRRRTADDLFEATDFALSPTYARGLSELAKLFPGHAVFREGPVRDDVLAKRIARPHGWTRTGGRIHDRVLNAVERAFTLVKDGDNHFVWPKSADTATWPTYRRPSAGSSRPVDETALPELAALAREIKAKGVEGDEALKETARIAGLQKLRPASRERLEMAWGMV